MFLRSNETFPLAKRIIAPEIARDNRGGRAINPRSPLWRRSLSGIDGDRRSSEARAIMFRGLRGRYASDQGKKCILYQVCKQRP